MNNRRSPFSPLFESTSYTAADTYNLIKSLSLSHSLFLLPWPQETQRKRKYIHSSNCLGGGHAGRAQRIVNKCMSRNYFTLFFFFFPACVGLSFCEVACIVRIHEKRQNRARQLFEFPAISAAAFSAVASYTHSLSLSLCACHGPNEWGVCVGAA